MGTNEERCPKGAVRRSNVGIHGMLTRRREHINDETMVDVEDIAGMIQEGARQRTG